MENRGLCDTQTGLVCSAAIGKKTNQWHSSTHNVLCVWSLHPGGKYCIGTCAPQTPTHHSDWQHQALRWPASHFGSSFLSLLQRSSICAGGVCFMPMLGPRCFAGTGWVPL